MGRTGNQLTLLPNERTRAGRTSTKLPVRNRSLFLSIISSLSFYGAINVYVLANDIDDDASDAWMMIPLLMIAMIMDISVRERIYTFVAVYSGGLHNTKFRCCHLLLCRRTA